MTETANHMAGKPKLPELKRSAKSPAIAGRKETLDRDRIAAVLTHAKEGGSTSSKGGRISGRILPEPIKRTKARIGFQSDTELVEFTLENNFLSVIRELKGTVDPDLDLGF